MRTLHMSNAFPSAMDYNVLHSLALDALQDLDRSVYWCFQLSSRPGVEFRASRRNSLFASNISLALGPTSPGWKTPEALQAHNVWLESQTHRKIDGFCRSPARSTNGLPRGPPSAAPAGRRLQLPPAPASGVVSSQSKRGCVPGSRREASGPS